MDRSSPEMNLASDGVVELARGVTAPAAALRLQFSRSGGPGGQNVNKLNTRAELWVRVDDLTGLDEHARHRLRRLAGKRLTQADEIHLAASAGRSQQANRRAVLLRLRDLVIRCLREPRPRRKTRPTAASRRRRLEQKRHRGEIKATRRAVTP